MTQPRTEWGKGTVDMATAGLHQVRAQAPGLPMRQRDAGQKEGSEVDMAKRIYTFEVEIDDTMVHERYGDGTCSHPSSESCDQSIRHVRGERGKGSRVQNAYVNTPCCATTS